jgi:hypothetical protein
MNSDRELEESEEIEVVMEESEDVKRKMLLCSEKEYESMKRK